MKKKVLIIAAHPDDELIGCGATLIKHKKKKDEISSIFISDGVIGKLDPKSGKKIINNKILNREAMALRVAKKLKIKNVFFLRYPNLNLHNSNKLEIVKKLIEKINTIKPDIVYIHSKSDLNPDHRIANECSITALRPTLKKNPKEIYAFEIPSSTDGALYQFGIFKPNVYVDIKNEIKEKISLLNFYKRELWKYPHPLSKKFLLNFASIAGSSCNLSFAERFETIRLIK